MSKIKEIFQSDYVFSIINKVVMLSVGFFTTAFVNRYLGAELKGEYAYIMNVVSFAAIIGNMGFYQSYPMSRRNNMPDITKKYINVFAFQFLIYFAIAIAFGIYSDDAKLFLAALMVPIVVITNQLAMIALIDFIRFRQKLNIVVQFINLIMTLCLFIFIKRSIFGAMVAFAIKESIFTTIYLVRIKYIPNPFNVSIEFIKYLFKFGIYAMLTSVLITMNYKLDVLMLKMHVPYEEIGLYSVGASLAEYAWLIPDAFKDVLFSRTAKNDSIKEISVAIRINMAITFILIAGILILGKPFINMLYGFEFVGAYEVTVIIFLGVPSMVLYKLTNPLYLANGKQRFFFITLLLSVIINVLLNLLLIPVHGKTGAAIASVFSYTTCGVIFYVRFIRDYNLKWYKVLFLTQNDYKYLVRKVKQNGG